MKFHSTILTATLLAVVLLLAGSCSRQGERSARKITDADSLIEAAHQSHNYEVLRQLVDSFQRAGSLSDIQANYWLGYVYSRKGQQRIAEIHWKNALNDEASDAVSLDYYARSASRHFHASVQSFHTRAAHPSASQAGCRALFSAARQARLRFPA